jgi:g-D-glutamyl-meso-diaminopimelate peptidase
MTADIKQLAADYPELVEYKSLGKTAFGRDIWAVKIGYGESTSLVSGSTHAREWISTNLNMYMLYQFAQAYNSNKSVQGYNVKEILNKNTIWFVPMVNPDGVTLQKKGLNAFPKKYHSQLIKLNNGSKDFKRWKANASGIDPNRNHDVDWDVIVNNAKYPTWRNHKGPKPEYIPEVITVVGLTYEVVPEITLAYHSAGEMLYWEYKTPKKNKARGRKIADNISSMTGYRLMFNTNTAAGSYMDWFISEFGRPGFTPELAKYPGNTNVPINQFDRIWKQNQAVPLYTAQEGYKLWLEIQKTVKLTNVKVDLSKETTLYTEPLKPTKATVSPSRVTAIAEKADWYQIKTWKGNMWIKKENTKEYTVKGFVDFQEGIYWSDSMIWAVDNGLIVGNKINNRQYLRPWDDLTEAQLLTVLFRYAKPNEFHNTEPESKYWASVAYQLAEKYQLPVKGSIDNHKAAAQAITRGDNTHCVTFRKPDYHVRRSYTIYV